MMTSEYIKKHLNISNIPRDWSIKRLRDIALVNPTKTKVENDSIEVSFVPMSAVSESGKLVETITKKYSEVSNGFTDFIDGDIIIAKITPCFENGKGALINGLKNGLGFGSTEFHVLRAKSNICNSFLFYHSTSYRFRKRGESNMTGSAGQKRIPADFIKDYSLLVPPLPEQKKIAQFLGVWDGGIEKTEKLIAAKQKRKKALMQQLLTGKKRFKEFKGEKWKEVKIQQVFKVLKRKNQKGIKRVLTASGQHGLVDQTEYFNRSVAGENIENYYLLQKGEFAYNRSLMNGYPYSMPNQTYPAPL